MASAMSGITRGPITAQHHGILLNNLGKCEGQGGYCRVILMSRYKTFSLSNLGAARSSDPLTWAVNPNPTKSPLRPPEPPQGPPALTYCPLRLLERVGERGVGGQHGGSKVFIHHKHWAVCLNHCRPLGFLEPSCVPPASLAWSLRASGKALGRVRGRTGRESLRKAPFES